MIFQNDRIAPTVIWSRGYLPEYWEIAGTRRLASEPCVFGRLSQREKRTE